MLANPLILFNFCPPRVLQGAHRAHLEPFMAVFQRIPPDELRARFRYRGWLFAAWCPSMSARWMFLAPLWLCAMAYPSGRWTPPTCCGR